MSSPVHANNENKDILVLGEGPTQGLDDSTISAEAKYSINFTQSGKKTMLTLYCNGINSFLFVNAVKMYQFKAKTSELKPYSLCQDNISEDFAIDNMQKTG